MKLKLLIAALALISSTTLFAAANFSAQVIHPVSKQIVICTGTAEFDEIGRLAGDEPQFTNTQCHNWFVDGTIRPADIRRQ